MRQDAFVGAMPLLPEIGHVQVRAEQRQDSPVALREGQSGAPRERTRIVRPGPAGRQSIISCSTPYTLSCSMYMPVSRNSLVE